MKADAPKKISKYDVVDLIGRGGMGAVYKAVDRALGRPVAIKVLTGAAEHSELERFYREAQFTASLRHPNIVVVYDLGDFEGRPYLVMEYLEGQSLESLLSTKTLTMLQKISYVRQVCSGLEYAHSRQPSIIHRDIKPANLVVLADGIVKIVDFGMARLVHSRHTRAGELIGTVHYMSPEQIRGLDLDARSDIFSTGVVLYQLLTSKLPFTGGGIAQTLKQIVGSPAPPLSQFIQGYSPALDHIISRALAKERDDRYSSASELSFDLLEVEEHLKGSLFGEHISRAERMLRDGQLDRARQELLNVLQIDREHVRANQLMRQLVQAAKKQGGQEEAIRLDNSNRKPHAVRDRTIAARARMEKLNDVLSRAERAYSAGDLEGASRAVDEAFELDPNAARAKSLNIQIAHKVAKHEQERRVQELLALARRHISERKFSDALEAVKKAERLNPAASGIQDLMASVASGHEQEERRRAVKRSATEILGALDGPDPSLASKLAQATVQQFPNEGELSQLKARAQRVGHQAWVAQQVAGTRALLAAGRNTDALAMVDAACRRSPGERELESLMVLVRSLIQREETERRRAEITAKAEDSLKRKNYAEAVQLLEAAKSEMKSTDFDELLRLVREEETQWQQKVDATAAQAQRLIASREYARAAEFLDSAAQELSSEDLRILAASARRQWKDYRQELDELIATADHLLEEGRPADAAACLEVKAATYGREPNFQSRLEQARQQQQKAAAIGKAATAIKASLSSGNWNEARLQLTAARHDLGDSAELRELEADIDRQEAHAIHEKMAATLREVEDLIRLIGGQALASLQSVDDLLDKAPPGLRKRHEELKIAVSALLEEVKREQMRYGGGPETGQS